MTEPVTLTCPDCGHEFPVHIAYGDPDTTTDDEDDTTTPPCGCCTRTDGHEPWCVCVQPDEYVIDDDNPGVLRPARPDDYSSGYTRAILRAQEDVNTLGAELEVVRRRTLTAYQIVSRAIRDGAAYEPGALTKTLDELAAILADDDDSP